MRKENYNGYELNTVWEDEALGFGFRIYGRDGAEVSCSKEPYFYEENAFVAAREAADALPAQG